MNKIRYNDPLAALARDLAHKGAFGSTAQVVVCKDSRTRHLLCVALVEWLTNQGWRWHEFDPCHFCLMKSLVIICQHMPERSFSGGVDVHRLEAVE